MTVDVNTYSSYINVSPPAAAPLRRRRRRVLLLHLWHRTILPGPACPGPAAAACTCGLARRRCSAARGRQAIPTNVWLVFAAACLPAGGRHGCGVCGRERRDCDGGLQQMGVAAMSVAARMWQPRQRRQLNAARSAAMLHSRCFTRRLPAQGPAAAAPVGPAPGVACPPTRHACAAPCLLLCRATWMRPTGGSPMTVS